MPKFPRGQNTSPGEDRIIRQVRQLPWMDGREFEFEIAGLGNVAVAHGLGRVPSGFLVTGMKDNAARIFISDSDDQSVVFGNNVAVTATCKVWVY